jgi:hypothetical protein
MDNEFQASLSQKIRKVVIGSERRLHDPGLFRRLSLIVFLAWVGLGVDGLTSSYYGREEAFLAMGEERLSPVVGMISRCTLLADYVLIITLSAALDAIVTIVDSIRTRYPNAVSFGGQMVFPRDNIFDRLLHNYTTFAVQKRFYRQGIPFLIIPARVEEYGGP